MVKNAIFALGSNGSGQLGLGHREDVSEARKSLFDGDIASSKPYKFAAGGNHTLVLFENGSVYAVGHNSDGRCGIDTSKANLDTFRSVVIVGESRQNARFKLCSATWEASTFVTWDNRVFTSGTGNRGELGQGECVNKSNCFKQIQGFPPRDAEVNDLGASMSHTVAVLSDGTVYGWGAGKKGQLGEPNGIVPTPRRIHHVGFKAVRAVCGREFTFIAGSPNGHSSLFFGSTKPFEKLGLPHILGPWKAIGANWNGVHILSQDGSLHSWGKNEHCQLAPKSLPKLSDIAVGSEHVVARTDSGQVIAWGWGEHGNCGKPTEAPAGTGRLWNVIQVEGSPLVVGAGCATSWICAETP